MLQATGTQLASKEKGHKHRPQKKLEECTSTVWSTDVLAKSVWVNEVIVSLSKCIYIAKYLEHVCYCMTHID